MEDGGTIGQWANNENLLSDMDDTISKLSVKYPNGALEFQDASLTATEAPLQLTASVLNAKRGSRRDQLKGKSSSVSELPPITSKQHGQPATKKPTTGKATAATARSLTSTAASARTQKATGSISSTPTGSVKQKGGKQKRETSAASGTSSRASSASKSAGRLDSKKRTKSPGSSSASLSARSSRKTGKGGGGSRSRSKGRDTKGKKGKRRKSTAGSSREGASTAALASLTALETERRMAIMEEQEARHNAFLPDYNFFIMNLVRTQLHEVNQRQQMLNDAFKVLQTHGIQLGFGQDPNVAFETLRAQVQAGMQKQMDEVRVENSTLRSLMDEKNAELERKNNELQNLRDKVNRKLMRFEVESESLKAEVQSALRTGQLDVDRMKRELGNRLDIATASLRTPKYDTALRSMQDLVHSVQEEIQDHHDALTKLIVSIGAQDTFLRDKSDSMHTNFPIRYRDELQKMEKDRLLNLLDVLSFNDTVVETVGKALYVMQKTEHSTNVF